MTLGTLLSAPYRMLASRLEDKDAPRGAELFTGDGRALPLTSSRLTAVAGGGIARVVLEQTFENPYAETLRVTYKMPLPADGAVSGYAFRIGARTIEGKVEPKEAARAHFEDAILEGRTAALLEQQRADIFTQEIGNIPAKTTIVAKITVDQPLAWLPEGEWELRFPTVIGPRYVGASDTDADIEAVKIEVAGGDEIGARIHLVVEVTDALAPGKKVSSPTHALVAGAKANAISLAARKGEKLDRDIVVRWPVARPEVGVSIRTARPKAGTRHGDGAFGLLTLVPPSPEAGAQRTPRDLVVLIDTSGSMGGAPLGQAKRVVALLLASLGDDDRIELVAFSSAPRPWKKEPALATADAKRAAGDWVNQLRAGGSTEMYTAVVAALASLRPRAQRQVVLVTDGYIGGEQQLVDLLHERLPEGCRMHFLGVGSAVNRSLATAIARAGRGAEVLVGPDEDAERASKRLLDRTAAPMLTDVVISGSAVIDVAPTHVPDVFAGAPVVCASKLAPHGGELVVRGKLGSGESWERRLRVPAIAPSSGDPGIVALYARERVADLEMRWTIGREIDAIDRAIELVGVDFQIATRRTSWVAIDDAPSVDPTSGSRRVTQPQEVPHGTSIASFGFAAPMDVGAIGPAGGVSFPTSMMMPQSFGMIAPTSMPAQPAMFRGRRDGGMVGAPKRRSRLFWVLLFVFFTVLFTALALLFLR